MHTLFQKDRNAAKLYSSVGLNMKCSSILHIVFLILRFKIIEADLDIQVIDGAIHGNALRCNNNVTIRCVVKPNTFLVQWYVGKTIGAQSDSDCDQLGCTDSIKYLGRYTYYYDQSAGISHLTIRKSNFDDDQMIYQCYNGSSTGRVIATIKAPPVLETTTYKIQNFTDSAVVTVSTGCIYPVGDISFTWYSTKDDNSDKKMHNDFDLEELTCTPNSNCLLANTSISSVLHINTTKTGEIRMYFVNILFDLEQQSIHVGNFLVASGQTIATTTDPGEKNLKLGLGFGLGISGGLLAAISAVVFVCLIKDPVHELTVTSPKFTGTTMTIKLKFKSRLCRMKTFHVKLKDREIITKCKDGVIELTGLIPDSNYSASVFSTICIFQSCKKNIDFHTKGRPFPPYNFCEEQTSRTESLVTLKWNRAKGPMHTFVIKYKRTKGRMRDWMLTERINDTRYTLDGLKSGTCYTLLIHAENDVGYSEDSEPLLVKTSALIPVPPEEFRCESVKEDEVILSWKPFKKIRKQQFILTFYNMSEELPPGQDRKDTRIYIPYTGKPVMTYKVIELKPSSKYMFELHTSAGKRISERSAIACVETTDRDEDAYDVHGKRKSRETTSVFHITHT